MPKPYDSRTLLGVVQISYREDGSPDSALFTPASFQLPQKSLGELCKVLPKGVDEAATTNIERVIAEWLLQNDTVETEDREVAKLETRTSHCELWPSGTLRLHEVEVWFARTEATK